MGREPFSIRDPRRRSRPLLRGHKPQLLASTLPNAKGALPASTAGSAPSFLRKGNCVPEFRPRMGCSFPQDSLAETTSRFERGFWDTVSLTRLSRKVCPILSAHSGTQFPSGPRFGKSVPFRASRLGCTFPQGIDAEDASHSERSFRDASSPRSRLATCRRRPGLLRVRRAPACGGGIRARRAWRAPSVGVRAG